MSIQIVQRGSHAWDVTKVEKIDTDAHAYELIGRVVLEGDIYYPEVVHWQDIGHTFERLPTMHGRVTKKAALRDLSRRSEKQV